jgi:ABC-type Fe3+/spermidine/putrescine transport system ATPase subunit
MSALGLEVEKISLDLGSFALREVSFQTGPGEILVLLGANGSGKSVCLEAIAGFHRTAAGRVLIGGREVTQLAPERRRIAFVVQNFGLFPHLTIAENVAIGGANGFDVGALLARFGIGRLARFRPEHLSPGEKQRAALARALASRPSAYLFDEPFAALDAATAEMLGGELAVFVRRSDAPTVFVTHDRAEAAALADRVAVIEGGTIRQHGPAAEVFARPNSMAIARLFGFENLLEGRIAEETSGGFRVAVGSTCVEVAKCHAGRVGSRCVTLCIRAETVDLLPPEAVEAPNRFAARVTDLRRSGPLLRVSLDCGFPLVAYALPQTARTLALAPGRAVNARIDAGAVHLLAAGA